MHPALYPISQKYIRGLALIAILCCSVPVVAQDIPDKSVPKEVQKAFSQRYHGNSEAYWTLQDGRYGVSFKTAKGYLDAWFTAKGKWIRTERIIEFEALPKAVVDSLAASDFSDWDIGDAYMVEFPGKVIRYKLYVYSTDWNELVLIFEANGNLIADLP